MERPRSAKARSSESMSHGRVARAVLEGELARGASRTSYERVAEVIAEPPERWSHGWAPALGWCGG